MRSRSVAVVFGGEPEAALSERLQPMAAALVATGLQVRPVPFSEGHESSVAARLVGADGALVWVDPLGVHGDRAALDEVLRDAESAGVWVSARPDVIDGLGTKKVLVTTRELGWGSDVHLYRSRSQLRHEFPPRLAASGVRVLKADRGNGGRTVWKVRLPGGPTSTLPGPRSEVLVQHARVRDGASTSMTLAGVMRLLEDARVFEGWAGTGCVVDQEFVPGITSGVIRCYLVGGTVVGFARQYPTGVLAHGPVGVLADTAVAPDDVMGLPSPKTMHPADEPALAGLRERLETDWIPATTRLLDLEPAGLPALWDVDLIPRQPHAAEQVGDEPTFALCEVNASSIIPFPPQAPARVAEHVAAALSTA